MQKSPIDDTTLRMLACPVCHAALALLPSDAVQCTACGRRYPMRDGLPILLASAAERTQ
ncbi:MAG TPA: Trm112 family protein [Acidobacteriaceae bacterium]|jgi:hypothetical protein